jgi:hypothetical protein
MLPFVVTILATVPQRLEILEELMNYPVYLIAEKASFHLFSVTLICKCDAN